MAGKHRGFVGRQRFSIGGTAKRKFDRAIRSAGATVGKEIARVHLRDMGRVSSRRRKAVKSLVGKDGMMVVVDLAPLAVAQEEGLTLRPTKSRYLRIPQPWVKRKRYQVPGRKFIRTGRDGKLYEFVLQKTPYSGFQRNNKAGNVRTKRAFRMVASLRPFVKVKKWSRGLRKLAEQKFPNYVDLIWKNIEKS